MVAHRNMPVVFSIHFVLTYVLEEGIEGGRDGKDESREGEEPAADSTQCD